MFQYVANCFDGEFSTSHSRRMCDIKPKPAYNTSHHHIHNKLDSKFYTFKYLMCLMNVKQNLHGE